MFKKQSGILLISLILGACSAQTTTHGHVIKDKYIQQIKVGMHDRMAVASLLGSPSSMSTFDDNIWYYITEKTVSETLKPNQLEERRLIIVKFDKNGKVASIGEKTKNDGQDISRLEKETPTHGQALGVIDQLIGNVGTGF